MLFVMPEDRALRETERASVRRARCGAAGVAALTLRSAERAL